MYKFLRAVLVRPLIKWGWKARIEGAHHIPATGGVILASNHISMVDTFVLPGMIDRQVTFPAKAELFKGDRGLGSKIVAWFLRVVGQVPLDRSGGRRSLEGLEPVLNVLNNGGVVGIYPEGTRSPDGRLYKGKTGVARMALATNVPVVPVAMINSEIVGKKLKFIPWAKNPTVRIGRPLDFSAYHANADDRHTLRWVTDEIMAAIQDLSGQTYVEAYGTSVKYGSMSEEEATRRIKARPGEGATPPELPAV